MIGRFAPGLLVIALLGCATPVTAQWKTVKKFVQPGVEIVEETKASLILKLPNGDALIVLSLRESENADIRGALEQQRGGNPYRVWVASANFWNDPDRPRRIWGRFFRVEFLKILRPPPDEGG